MLAATNLGICSIFQRFAHKLYSAICFPKSSDRRSEKMNDVMSFWSMETSADFCHGRDLGLSNVNWQNGAVCAFFEEKIISLLLWIRIILENRASKCEMWHKGGVPGAIHIVWPLQTWKIWRRKSGPKICTQHSEKYKFGTNQIGFCLNGYSKIWWDTPWHINGYKQINDILFRQRITAGSATDL